MSNYELLKTAIDAVIKANGRAEITGAIMNQTLIAMVNSLGRGYQFVGVATPEINPNTPDEKVFYLAMQAGTYTNFGNITLRTGLTVLTWDGDWHAATVFATDTTPNYDSADLITSGAVYNALKNDGGAYDVSVHFPTGGENGGNTYTLANAIAKVPVNMRKGGMSIKFIDASTNKYVKHTYLNPTTDGFTNVNNWQGIVESAAGFHTIGSAKNHQLASIGALVEEFGIKCVNSLPTASASTMNKIYSIPTAHPVAGKRRDEYFTVETGIAPDYTEVKDLITVTSIPDNALGAQVGEGKFIANDTANNKAYYFTSVHAENEWGYEVTVEEVASGKVARMLNELQYASNGTAWVADYHYADYTWESLSPDLSSLATKSEVADVAHALVLTALDCENMTSIEYDELVQMRDDGELIPGKWYRIVDYHTTTAQEDTQSADHQFDVIVRADAVNKLNENAFAAISHGDTYFTNAGAKLEAWKLKYCLDNDTDRFAWADDRNGKGVIYWMRDEWGNECPYDFKNIMFKRSWCDYYGRTAIYFSIIGLEVGKDHEGLTNQDDTDWMYLYTFNYFRNQDSDAADKSVVAPATVQNNIIMPFKEDDCIYLNNIVNTNGNWQGDSMAINNVFIDCKNITTLLCVRSTLQGISNTYIANFDKCVGKGADIQYCNSECSFVSCDFSSSTIGYCSFNGSKQSISYKCSMLSGCSFLSTEESVVYDNCYFSNNVFEGEIYDTSFNDSVIEECETDSDTTIELCNFQCAKVDGTGFSGSLLRCSFGSAYLKTCGFNGEFENCIFTNMENITISSGSKVENLCQYGRVAPANVETMSLETANYLTVLTCDNQDNIIVVEPYI